MLNIRKATESDLDTLLNIRLETLRVVNALPEETIFNKLLIDTTKNYFKNPNQTTVLAIDNAALDNEAIGCATICYINIMPTFDHPSGKRAHIMNVYVRKSYRRQGIAFQMMNLLIKEAIQKGISEISLDSTESGFSLYEKCGFTKTQEGMILQLHSQIC